MAFGLGNTSYSYLAGHGTSITWSHNNNGNQVVVGVPITDCTNTPITGLGVTYGGIAMTQIGIDHNGKAWVALFRLFNAPSGANNVVVSWTNAAWGMAWAISFPDSQDLVGTFVSAAADTVDVPSAEREYAVDCINCYGDTAITVGAGQTQIAQDNRQSDYDVTSGDNMVGAGSYEAGAATVTMNWTGTAGTKVICGVSIKPAANQQIIMF